MNFRSWFENNDDWELNYEGIHFKNGQPVTFPYLKNTQKAPNFGSLYQQDIEPHGKYIVQHYHGHVPDERWETGHVSFRNPLIIPFNSVAFDTYNDTSWKKELSKRFGGKTGRKLSLAIIKAGYDGIITVSIGPDGKPYETREIVDLRDFK